jgi:hypothetical protein
VTTTKFRVGQEVLLSTHGRQKWAGEPDPHDPDPEPDDWDTYQALLADPERRGSRNPPWLIGKITDVSPAHYHIRWDNGINNTGYQDEDLMGTREGYLFKDGDRVMLSPFAKMKLTDKADHPYHDVGIISIKAGVSGYKITWPGDITNGQYYDQYLIPGSKKPEDPKETLLADLEREEALDVMRELADLMGYDLVKRKPS